MHFRHKSCIPTQSGRRNKIIPVWLYQHQSTSGVQTPECSTVTLEEHTECQCGCAKNANSCQSNQIFRESICSCECTNQAAKYNCYDQPGYIWDEDTCRCLNQRNTIPSVCETVCIDYNIEYAHPALIITIMVLFSGIITASVTLFHCYRKNIGVFGRKRREEIMENIRKNSEELSKADMFTLPLVNDESEKKSEKSLRKSPDP